MSQLSKLRSFFSRRQNVTAARDHLTSWRRLNTLHNRSCLNLGQFLTMSDCAASKIDMVCGSRQLPSSGEILCTDFSKIAEICVTLMLNNNYECLPVSHEQGETFNR